MNITLFGGAFDPPHNGHLQIARELLSLHLADEVWFLPVKYHAFDKKLTAGDHRLAMLKRFIEPKMKIETYELQQDSTNFTYNTLVSLRQHCPEHTFSFVIGSDNLANFHKWDNFEEMVRDFTFYVYPRKGYPLEPLQDNMVILDKVQEIDVSSTEVKKLVHQDEPIDSLVPPVINSYIKEHNLYKD